MKGSASCTAALESTAGQSESAEAGTGCTVPLDGRARMGSRGMMECSRVVHSAQAVAAEPPQKDYQTMSIDSDTYEGCPVTAASHQQRCTGLQHSSSAVEQLPPPRTPAAASLQQHSGEVTEHVPASTGPNAVNRVAPVQCPDAVSGTCSPQADRVMQSPQMHALCADGHRTHGNGSATACGEVATGHARLDAAASGATRHCAEPAAAPWASQQPMVFVPDVTPDDMHVLLACGGDDARALARRKLEHIEVMTALQASAVAIGALHATPAEAHACCCCALLLQVTPACYVICCTLLSRHSAEVALLQNDTGPLSTLGSHAILLDPRLCPPQRDCPSSCARCEG
jgi:hypothetical protein